MTVKEGNKIADSEAVHIETSRTLTKLETVETTATGLRPRDSFVSRLKLYTATYTDVPLWKLLIAPFLTLANPAVVWAVLVMAFPILWVVAVNLLIAQIFSSPPYLLSTAELGYISAGPAVGGLLGSILCGLISDPIIKWLSRKNNGVYEPEFRLIPIIPAIALAAIAYFPFGSFVTSKKSPVIMATLWGVATASVQICISVVGGYIVDAYRSQSVEIFIITMVIKNFIFFGFTCKHEIIHCRRMFHFLTY